MVATGPATARDRRGVRLRAGAPAARARVEPRASSAPRSSRRARTTRCAASSTPPGAGMVATLRLPGDARGARPAVGAGADRPAPCWTVVDARAPDHVLVDHLAFSARLALRAARRPARRRRARPPDARCRSATRSTATRPPGRPPSAPTRPSWPQLRRAVRATSATPSPPSGTPPLQTLAPRRHAVDGRVRRARRRCCCCNYPGELARPGTHGAAAAARLPRLGACAAEPADAEVDALARATSDARSSTSASAASCPCAATCWPGGGRAARPRACGSALAIGSRRAASWATLPADWLVRRVPAAGRAARDGGRCGHPRRQQQRHRVAGRRRADARAAVLHRPVRRRRRDRARRGGRGPGPERGHGRRAPCSARAAGEPLRPRCTDAAVRGSRHRSGPRAGQGVARSRCLGYQLTA